MNLVEELRWRGMIHDMMPGTEEQLQKEMTTGYIGFDPTADSLHVGSLVQIILLMHLQRAGHRPIALVGGATGMVGDPSGKSEERNLLSEDAILFNAAGVKKQLERFLDFGQGRGKAVNASTSLATSAKGAPEPVDGTSRGEGNAAIMENNYNWFKDMGFLEFIRDVGKHITISYMMAKDSVQKRLETGLSFTEFTYQLVQGYDFYHLYQAYGCKLQMGGSDQWGNIVTGTELIRRKAGGEAFALTTPLITKADGSKFGKTEEGNIWLDRERTSPYKFYQFWLNASDEDAEKYIKIFTFLPREEIESLIAQHQEAPHTRLLQKMLAKELTVMIHSEEDYESAIETSEILFGRGTAEGLARMTEENLLAAMEGVPHYKVSMSTVENGINIVELLVTESEVFPSKGEARKMITGGGVSVNKEKVQNADIQITKADLIKNRFLLVQKGKKNYYLLEFK